LRALGRIFRSCSTSHQVISQSPWTRSLAASLTVRAAPTSFPANAWPVCRRRGRHGASLL